MTTTTQGGSRRSQATVPDESERCSDCGHFPGCDCTHQCTPQGVAELAMMAVVGALRAEVAELRKRLDSSEKRVDALARGLLSRLAHVEAWQNDYEAAWSAIAPTVGAGRRRQPSQGRRRGHLQVIDGG